MLHRKNTEFRRVALLLIFILSSLPSAFTQTPSATHETPALQAPLAHDEHQGFNVSADPYTDPARIKDRFGKSNPYEAGILPVDVSLTNKTAQAMRVNLDDIRLDVAQPGAPAQHLQSLTVDEVADHIAYPSGTPSPESSRTPLPGPLHILHHDKKAEKIEESIRPLALDADVIAPGATVHGFLFFDLGHHFEQAANASLYVPDVRSIVGAQSLTFFEVPLKSISSH
jgi:hypothetical protein